MSKVWLGLIAATLLAGSPLEAQEQEWRTINSRRQFAGEDRLRVEVEFGAGTLKVGPASPGSLYSTTLRYDASAFKPVTSYRNGLLKVGLDGSQKLKTSMREGARLTVGLGPDVPIDLDLAFGAAEAELELGGLRIRNTKIATGASQTRLRFSEPNPERMSVLSLAAGAAAIRVEGLGHANAERIRFEGGVGDVVLDFTGDWRGNARVDVEMGLGALTLRIPRGLGVRIEKEGFLLGIDSQELIKRGGAYFSENWSSAEHRLTIGIEGAFGTINVQWVSDTGAPADGRG